MRKVDVFRFFVDTQNDNYGDTVKRRVPTSITLVILNEVKDLYA